MHFLKIIFDTFSYSLQFSREAEDAQLKLTANIQSE